MKKKREPCKLETHLSKRQHDAKDRSQTSAHEGNAMTSERVPEITNATARVAGVSLPVNFVPTSAEDAAQERVGMTSVDVQITATTTRANATTTTQHSNARLSPLFSWHPSHHNTPVVPSGYPQYTGALRRRLCVDQDDHRTHDTMRTTTRQRSLTSKLRSRSAVHSTSACLDR